jgi:hypothetical protein
MARPQKIEPPTKISAHCSSCTSTMVGINHHRCFSLNCACQYHKAYSSRRKNATREEQHARYIDCGPNNWDDRD